MIQEHTLCDNRLIRISHNDLFHAPWGSAALCCDACIEIAKTRDSWWEAFAEIPAPFENAGQFIERPF